MLDSTPSVFPHWATPPVPEGQVYSFDSDPPSTVGVARARGVCDPSTQTVHTRVASPLLRRKSERPSDVLSVLPSGPPPRILYKL